MENTMNPNSGGARTLWLTEAEREAIKDFWVVYDAHYDEISAATLGAVSENSELMALVNAIPPEKLEEQSRASRERMRRAMLKDEWEPYLENLRREGANYGQAGVSFLVWYELLSAYNSQVVRLLFREYEQTPDRLLSVLSAYTKFINHAMAMIGEAYLDTKESIIRQQQEAIMELSTPVLALHERLLLLPIVGLLDSHRAQQLTEHLLRAIRDYRARVVVIDITGVPTVDSMVANHLIKTAEAARLMGAKAIITGLSTEIAQTLVRIGVDLSRLHTLGDLRSGIEEAEHLLGFEIVRLKTAKTTIELDQDEAL